jgi:hypothetical protein
LKPVLALEVIQNIEKTISRRASGSGTVGLSSPKNSTDSNEDKNENNEPQFQKLNNINSVELQYYQLIISIVSKILLFLNIKLH